jgi:hypothetical protein
MPKDTVVAFRAPNGFSPDPLTDLLRQGARQLIAQAFEAELNGFLAAHADQTYPSGLTGVDLFGCPVPRHEILEAGHFVVCDAGENPAKPGLEIWLKVGDGP